MSVKLAFQINSTESTTLDNTKNNRINIRFLKEKPLNWKAPERIILKRNELILYRTRNWKNGHVQEE